MTNITEEVREMFEERQAEVGTDAFEPWKLRIYTPYSNHNWRNCKEVAAVCLRASGYKVSVIAELIGTGRTNVYWLIDKGIKIIEKELHRTVELPPSW